MRDETLTSGTLFLQRTAEALPDAHCRKTTENMKRCRKQKLALPLTLPLS